MLSVHMNSRPKRRPWDVENGSGRRLINVRLPSRALAQARYIAEREDRSQQKIIERILVPALEHQAEELWIVE